MKRISRQEQSEVNRQLLWRAAGEIIAEFGFKDASIIRITQRANLGQGTFYNYFETREALFSELLGHYGKLLRRTVAAALDSPEDIFVREERAFAAYFVFLRDNPFFVKVLNEAEIFVPDAFKQYFDDILNGYRRVLVDAADRGQIRPLTALQVESVALTFMAARAYYGQRFFSLLDGQGRLPPEIVDAYMMTVRGTLTLAPGPG